MENQTIDISVILPIESTKHKNFETLFESCITSIKNQSVCPSELIIVHTDEELLKNFLENYYFDFLNVRLIENSGDSDFATQVNLGVGKATNPWVSVIEFDDEYASIWFKNVKRFIESYDDVNAFLPLVVDVDDKGIFAGFTNEATFAANINTEIGYLTNEVLLNYQNFQTSGMVIKKDTWIKYGGLKKSMVLTFVYEFLLRLTYNNVKIMTIPRIGYKHINMREGSIFWNYKFGENKLSKDEVSFWMESAKKEYFFTEDRNINFETTNN